MQVGSFGFNLILTTKLDLTNTTDMQVVLLRPDSSYVEKRLSATAFTPPTGTDQPWVVAVPIEQGDLSVVGPYRIQLIDVTAGRSLPSAIGSFNVLKNLK